MIAVIKHCLHTQSCSRIQGCDFFQLIYCSLCSHLPLQEHSAAQTVNIPCFSDPVSLWTRPSIFLFFIYFILFIFLPHHAACRILVPQPGIEPMPPAVEVGSPSHWTAREFPTLHSFQPPCLALSHTLIRAPSNNTFFLEVLPNKSCSFASTY